MSRPTTSRWTYEHLKPEPGADVRLIRITDTQLALRVPVEVVLRGVIVVERPGSDPRAVAVDLQARLEGAYVVVEQRLVRVTEDDLEEQFPELIEMGVGGTDDIDTDLNGGIRWAELRRRLVADVEVVTIWEDGAEKSTDLASLADREQVAVLWHRAVLADDDPAVLISDRMGITRDAAKGRLKRAREAGLLPPVRQGQRKAAR